MNTETIQILNISLDRLSELIECGVESAMRKRDKENYLNQFNKYPEQMTRHEVSEVLNISPNYVTVLAKQGCFKRVKVSERKSFYVKETVEQYWNNLINKEK